MAELPNIIAVHGFKQSGKDTLAQLLVQEFGYRRVAFADRVKEALHVIFNVPREDLYGSDEDKQKLTIVRWEDLVDLSRDHRDHTTFLSIRELLQIFATEICRSKCPSIWYRYLSLPADERIVVSDLRFENEAKFLMEKKAILLKVVRPCVGSSPHESELGLPDALMDHIIHNDGDLDLFFKRARALMKTLTR